MQHFVRLAKGGQRTPAGYSVLTFRIKLDERELLVGRARTLAHVRDAGAESAGRQADQIGKMPPLCA